LKIDRSFISGMGDDGEGMEIARTIMPMANNLCLDVVAEGVETVQQLALLQKLQCKYGQGYYFSRPLTAEGTATLLAGVLTWKMCEQTK
jgi:EAL domain-containing protein (putative c-di-GMP-specific phosphodiesterase class I)